MNSTNFVSVSITVLSFDSSNKNKQNICFSSNFGGILLEFERQDELEWLE
jgi:hypothetical protein